MYKTENEIKMALGLNVWRNLLFDKVIRFARMIPEMDADLLMMLSGEIPQLRDYARQTLSTLEGIDTQESDQADLDYMTLRKLIALDEFDKLTKEQAIFKRTLLSQLLDKMEQVKPLYNFDASLLQNLCKRNQDGLRAFLIAMLVYVGGCLQEPESEDFSG